MKTEIYGKKIIGMKESYCLGEACLVIQYEENIKSTVAFYSGADLKRAIQMIETILKEMNKKIKLELSEDTITFHSYGFTQKTTMTNERQAHKFLEILHNAINTKQKIK